MNITLESIHIAEVVSKFYDKSYDEKDIENGTVTEEMVRFAILCDFEVIHREDYEDTIKRLCNNKLGQN